MRYLLDKDIVKMKDEQKECKELIIEVVSREEYEKKFCKEMHMVQLLGSMDNYQYCKADLLQTCTIGTLVIPDKSDLIQKEICFGYYMDKQRVLLIDDTGVVQSTIEEIKNKQTMEMRSVAHFFFEFLEYLVRDEVQFLQDYERIMTDMEEELLGTGGDSIPGMILKSRKELVRLNSYYNQLIDMSETFKENYNGLLSKEDSNLFRLFSDRIERLAANTQNLREYALQIREMYQTQIDIRQNQVMKFLTVVTTIFMPLTLVTGWYGMNFNNMPEIYFKHSYLIIILLSVIVVCFEIWYFKRKKWL